MMKASRKTSPVLCTLLSISTLTLSMAACGGGGGGGTTTPPPVQKQTPTVTVTPASQSITTIQSLSVTVTVSGTNGTPTGSVILSSGAYVSSATTLSAGSASISVPAATLAAGTDTLSASYTPDTAGAADYNNASGSGSVMVAKITPNVAVTPAPPSINITQSLSVTVSVSGPSGGPTPSGSVVLSSGAYTSAAATLMSGSVSITIPAGTLASPSATLTASYTPDPTGAAVYNSATGAGQVTVTTLTPTVTVTPALGTITEAQSVMVTVSVSGTDGTPAGTVTLSSGSYSSAATTLSSGSATITIPAASLPVGTDTLSASYTPGTASMTTYSSATGTGSIKVTGITPTVTVSPASTTVSSAQSLSVTVTVNGGTGAPTPTGSVTLTSGTYTSSAATLASGSAQITVPAGSLAVGSDTLSAAYTPDSASSGTYTSASGTASVTVDTGVTVNQSSTGAAVTDQILGLNMAVWFDFTANTSAIVDAFQSTGVATLRWPGGSTSDVYHWNGTNANPANGVAPVPSTCESAYQNPNTNYLNFIRDLEFGEPGLTSGFDVALTADYGTNPACTGGGSPSEAANWVQYAYANGGTVSHVTVGNEDYGSWEEDMHAVQHDPTTYADSVTGANGYYSSIKAQSASTLVGVIVDANCTTSNGCTDGWDSTVLSGAKGSYDFVEYHFYPQNPGDESDSFLVHSAAQELTTNINTVKSELATAGEANTPIYVGEMGSVSSSPGKQSMSITQGLYAGQLLGEMMNDGVSRATWWIGFGNCNGTAGNNSSSLYGWQDFGAYNIFSDGSEDPTCTPWGSFGSVSPTSVAYQLFSNVAVNGQKVLTSTVSGDTTDVRAYAATNPSGTALVLFNLNETTAENVVVALSSEISSPGITEYTYDKEMYDYTNASCESDPTCTYDPTHNYSTAQWVGPSSTPLGMQTLPLTVTLAPWSMNVFIIQ
jgi:hypothetical protein